MKPHVDAHASEPASIAIHQHRSDESAYKIGVTESRAYKHTTDVHTGLAIPG
jgi:hypothetical protein